MCATLQWYIINSKHLHPSWQHIPRRPPSLASLFATSFCVRLISATWIFSILLISCRYSMLLSQVSKFALAFCNCSYRVLESVAMQHAVVWLIFCPRAVQIWCNDLNSTSHPTHWFVGPEKTKEALLDSSIKNPPIPAWRPWFVYFHDPFTNPIYLNFSIHLLRSVSKAHLWCILYANLGFRFHCLWCNIEIWLAARLHSKALILISFSKIGWGVLVFLKIFSLRVNQIVHIIAIRHVPPPWEDEIALKYFIASSKEVKHGRVSMSNQFVSIFQPVLA